MEFLDPPRFFTRNKNAFNEIYSEVSAVLPHARIEHIGSSAVIGLISKGDLDVFVGVEPQTFADALSKLKSLGYREKKDPLRTPSLCMLVVERYTWDAAIQLVANGSEFEFFLDFRDKLSTCPRLVEQYNELKTQCTGMEADEYRNVKSQFIESTLCLS